MAKEAEEEKKEDGEEVKKPGKMKLIILIAAVGLVVGGGSLAAMKMMGGEKVEASEELTEDGMEDDGTKEPTEDAVADEGAPTEDGGSLVHRNKGVISELKPIVVNLKGYHGTRYLKITLGMEAKKGNTDIAAEIAANEYPIHDKIIGLLSNLKIEEIDDLKGKNKLKRELRDGINEILEKGVISRVYFKEFIIK